jgi:hypothetical protein
MPTTARNFITNGRDYAWTDTGNHHGYTHTMNLDQRRIAYQAHAANRTHPNPYAPTKFALIHMQSLMYNEWITHYLRGATTGGFNKLGNDLPKKCKGKSEHYCKVWTKMVKSNFDYWSMKEIFKEQNCPPDSEIIPVGDLFLPYCA